MRSRRKFVWLLLAAVLVLGLVAPQAFARTSPGCEAAATLVRNESCSYVVSGTFVGVQVSGVMAQGAFQIFVDGTLCNRVLAVASVNVDESACGKNVSPGFHTVRMVVGGGLVVLRATSGPI